MKTTFIVSVYLLITLSYVNTHPMHSEVMDLIASKPVKDQFKMWHYVMQRPYDLNSEVALQKYKVFKQNVKLIEETNAKKLSFELGLGPFTDMTFEEYRQGYLSLNMSEVAKQQESESDDQPQPRVEQARGINFDELADKEDDDDSEIPVRQGAFKSQDWSYLYNYVKDQSYPYGCGSCWAFGTIGIIEAFLHMNEPGNFLRLSEQQLLDCDSQSGCRGGWYRKAFNHLQTNGIMSEEDYPYMAYVSHCKYSKSKVVVRFGGVDSCTSNGSWGCRSGAAIEAIKIGPYATTIFADNPTFMQYRRGIWNGATCGQFDHAVIIVEVNEQDSYYKFRNSWNQYWGENGYGRISLDIYSSGHGKNWCHAKDHVFQPKNVRLEKN